jgi:CheY-like chemotaxis protein
MPSPAESGTILVVDDDRAVRTLVETCLGRGGYATLTADSGEIALKVFEQHRAEIALLLTDVTMPGIDGWELARRIQQAEPKLPVLVMSALAAPEKWENLRFA